MKYTPEQYATAFWEVMNSATGSSRDQIVKQFVQTCAKYGDLNRKDQIMQAIEHAGTQQKGGRVIKLEFAREQKDKVVDTLRKAFTKDDLVQSAINPSLIAGVRVTIDGQHELDMSMQRKLTKLFKHHE